jgi:hypothetical protein
MSWVLNARYFLSRVIYFYFIFLMDWAYKITLPSSLAPSSKNSEGKNLFVVLECWFFRLLILKGLLGNNVGSGSRHTAVVVLLRHEDVAVVAPIRGPGILHKPKLFTIQFAITDGKNSVILCEKTMEWSSRKWCLFNLAHRPREIKNFISIRPSFVYFVMVI